MVPPSRAQLLGSLIATLTKRIATLTKRRLVRLLPPLWSRAKAAMQSATPLSRYYASSAGRACPGFRPTGWQIALGKRITAFVETQFHHPLADGFAALRTGFSIVRVFFRLRWAWPPTCVQGLPVNWFMPRPLARPDFQPTWSTHPKPQHLPTTSVNPMMRETSETPVPPILHT